MKEFFDQDNFDKLQRIIRNNIQQHPNYDHNIEIESILKKNMIDIYNTYKKTYEPMNISDQILQYNSNTIKETIPKIINILNDKKEGRTASAIDKFIKQKLIPESELKMDPKYMNTTSRENIDLNKLYQDTTNINLNERNSLKVDNPNSLEPKDLYRENTQAKEILQQKQLSELNSNQKILDITTKIFNETSKGRDRYMEEYITISSLDRNTTTYPFSNDSKFVVEFSVSSDYSGANIGKLYKNIISIELLNIQIPLIFRSNDDSNYGIGSYTAILDTTGNAAATYSPLPYIYLSIEEFNDKNYNSSTNPVFTKLHKISKNGASATLEATDGKKIFRRTELKTIRRLTIEFLQPDGTPFKFYHGNIESGSPTLVGTTVNQPHYAISLDFKLTILEPSFENIN